MEVGSKESSGARGLHLPGCCQVWAPDHPGSAGERKLAAEAGAAAVAGNAHGEASPHPPLRNSGTEERAKLQRILGKGSEVSNGLHLLA